MAFFDELLQAAAVHYARNRPLIPMYIHLILSALFPIYTGAHASLSRPSSAAKAKKSSDDGDDEEEEDVQKMEGMTPKDAIMFPITAGIVLTGLYFAIKAYGASIINLVLGVYFSVIGTFSVAKLISDGLTTLASIAFPSYYQNDGKLWKILDTERKAVAVGSDNEDATARSSPLGGPFGRLSVPEPLLTGLWRVRSLVKQEFVVKGYWKGFIDVRAISTRLNFLSMLLGVVAVCYSLLADRPWWLTNLQGFAFSYGRLGGGDLDIIKSLTNAFLRLGALQLLSPTTFGTGSLILAGLFFYDIWAVFFTPLMITVAKNLDVPIKLVFPRPEQPSATPGEPPVRSFSMLGLGDIVLPGLMIGLALRFDLYMFYIRKQKSVAKQAEDGTTVQEVVKAPYVSVSGNWGEKLWTSSAAPQRASSIFPAQLATRFPKPYFTVTMVGYVLGMVATLLVMSIFDHGQPALLYLVPGVLISLWGTALVRGEVQELWQFSEAITTEAEEDLKQEENEKQKDDNKESEPKSLFGSFWTDLFGSNEKDSKEKQKQESTSDQASRSAERTEDEEVDAGSDVVFSLTITRHKPEGHRTNKNSTVTSQDATGTGDRTAPSTHKAADSIADDAVLVSSADLDGAKDAKRPRRRGNGA